MKYPEQKFKLPVIDGLGNIINEIDIVLKDTKILNQSTITDSKMVADFMRDQVFKDAVTTYEQFYVIYLNQKNDIIGVMNNSKGGITATSVDVELIMAAAVKTLAKSVIIIHNHPSGNLRQSAGDENITKNIIAAAKIFDIRVLDHLIITKQGHMSFSDQGLMGMPGINKKINLTGTINNTNIMINSTNYYDAIKNINIATLPEALKKGAGLVDKMTSQGANWNMYNTNESIKRGVDTYFQKLAEYLPEKQPAAPASPQKGKFTELKELITIAKKKYENGDNDLKTKHALAITKNPDTGEYNFFFPMKGEYQKGNTQLDTGNIVERVYYNEKVEPAPEPVKPTKQKTAKIAKAKKQKPEKQLPEFKGQYVERLQPEIKFIQRFVAMDQKTKIKEQILAFINAMQRTFADKSINKNSAYKAEMKFIQETLVDIINKMGKQIEVKISPDRFRTLKDYSESEKVMLSVVYIKQYIGLQGKDDIKIKAASLLKRVKKARETGKIPDDCPYIDKIKDMIVRLGEVSNGKAKVITIEPAELNGLRQICSCSGVDVYQSAKQKVKKFFKQQRPRIYHKPELGGHVTRAINSMELKNQTFKTLGLQGKFKELLGDPAEPFTCMIYGGGGSGKTTLAIELAHTLAAEHNRKIAYVSKEEKLGATLQEKFSRLDAYHENIMLFPDQLPKNISDFNYLFIDSINEMKLTIDDMKRIIKENPIVSFVILFKATKDGNFRGTNDWEHLVDIVIECSEGIARPEKSRFGGKGVIKIYNIDESVFEKFTELPKAEDYKTKKYKDGNIVKGHDNKYWVVSPAYAALMKQNGFEIVW